MGQGTSRQLKKTTVAAQTLKNIKPSQPVQPLNLDEQVVNSKIEENLAKLRAPDTIHSIRLQVSRESKGHDTLRNRQKKVEQQKQDPLLNHRWNISHLTEYYGKRKATGKAELPDYMNAEEKNAINTFYNIYETSGSSQNGIYGSWAYSSASNGGQNKLRNVQQLVDEQVEMAVEREAVKRNFPVQ